MIEWLAQLSFVTVIAGSLLVNLALFAATLIIGGWLVKHFGEHRVTAEPDPIEPAEIWLAISCVFLNSAIAAAGWVLWRHGYIVLKNEVGWRNFFDTFGLLVVMDLAMYLLHRVAHHPWLFPLVHRTHHRYDRPRPLNLFVLNPFEVLGFGMLWLLVLMTWSVTWIGMITFLILNLAFGTLGHLGVEPYPKSWKRLPLIKHLGSSTFHANHHQDEHVNFGFYSDIWDRLFRTQKHQSSLHPDSRMRKSIGFIGIFSLTVDKRGLCYPPPWGNYCNPSERRNRDETPQPISASPHRHADGIRRTTRHRIGAAMLR